MKEAMRRKTVGERQKEQEQEQPSGEIGTVWIPGTGANICEGLVEYFYIHLCLPVKFIKKSRFHLHLAQSTYAIWVSSKYPIYWQSLMAQA